MLFPEFNIKHSFLADENTGVNKMQYLSASGSELWQG